MNGAWRPQRDDDNFVHKSTPERPIVAIKRIQRAVDLQAARIEWFILVLIFPLLFRSNGELRFQQQFHFRIRDRRLADFVKRETFFVEHGWKLLLHGRIDAIFLHSR